MSLLNSGKTAARRLVTAGIAALALGAGTVAVSAPAQAFGGHGGGFGGGGAIFRSGGFGGGGVHAGGIGRGVGYGLGGLGLGLAASSLYGAYDNYGNGYGCIRNVATPYGYQAVNVCNG